MIALEAVKPIQHRVALTHGGIEMVRPPKINDKVQPIVRHQLDCYSLNAAQASPDSCVAKLHGVSCMTASSTAPKLMIAYTSDLLFDSPSQARC